MLTKTEHLSFKLKSIIAMVSFVLCCLYKSQAQSEGIRSFYADSLLRVQVKKHKVSSVRENSNKSNFTTQLIFDNQGRVIETSNSNAASRHGMTYDNNDRIIKRTYYSIDTSKIAYWDSFNYDEKGRLIGQEQGVYAGDKLVVSKIKDSKIILDNKDKAIWEVYNYYQNKLYLTEYVRDSTVGIYSFSTVYKYGIGKDNVDEKGRKKGEKILSRSYTENNCFYSNEVEYKVVGHLETVEKVKTYYNRYDERGRLLEVGEIDYLDGYMDFLEEHPEQYNGCYCCIMSQPFVETVFAGKVKGKEIMYGKYTYGEKGFIVEQRSKGSEHIYDEKHHLIGTYSRDDDYYTYKFKYNGKGQVIEKTTIYEGSRPLLSKTPIYTTLFWYNEKGLPIKSQTKTDNEIFGELIYTYTYY